ncbi:type I methionyl aminopeptidase [Desulfurobacterium atlanticum]|uniref:Methionine aminopeptidase n=1 Tax=Desulfurobacterium atlanticum TaxID=240169 RepID=A0A238ZNK9_9BACT|nr:type I methionyl aminopeptidase [Desulfurobacterium atlanticum]SNR84910.1 methionine aminopeptidase, type I [Desulfurobacterium atlanticum]
MVKALRRQIPIKTSEEIGRLRNAAALTMEILLKIGENISPGITALDIDKLARSYCKEYGVKPAFLGYAGFPGAICVSVNEEVVHGLPTGRKIFKEGDIVSLDFGVIKDGFYGDVAITFPVGDIADNARKLLEVTKESLYKGIEQLKPGGKLIDVSRAIQKHVESHGFSVVRDYAGHGIGKALHEEPQITNYVYKGYPDITLEPGMVFAIEPMVNEGTYKVKVKRDRWTVVTKDGKLSAHFEHDVAIIENGYIILSEI